jgi:hypothetical protein
MEKKCAQAYVIAKASGNQIELMLIANHRLLKDERRAAECYRSGCIPDSINTHSIEA